MFRQKFEGVLIFAKFQGHKAESWMLLTVIDVSIYVFSIVFCALKYSVMKGISRR